MREMWYIRKEEGKYHKATMAVYVPHLKALYLKGKRPTKRGTFAHFVVKKINGIKNAEEAEKKLRELGFSIIKKINY